MLTTSITIPSTIIVLVLAAFTLLKLWPKLTAASEALFKPNTNLIYSPDETPTVTSLNGWIRFVGSCLVFAAGFFAWVVVVVTILSPATSR